jgi:hypothetical protein
MGARGVENRETAPSVGRQSEKDTNRRRKRRRRRRWRRRKR